jgi:hypothetical protein
VFGFSTCFRMGDSCGSLESGNRESLESGNRGSLELGSRGNRESRTGEALESRTCEIVHLDPRNSGVMDEVFGNQKEAKSKTLPQKSVLGV